MKFKTVIVEDTVESVKNALRELDKSLKEGTGIAFEIKIENRERKKRNCIINGLVNIENKFKRNKKGNGTI
jgi:hypothetical protein